MLNEENYKQAIFEFADKKYGRRFKEFYNEFYDDFPDRECDFDDGELYFKNFIDWLHCNIKGSW